MEALLAIQRAVRSDAELLHPGSTDSQAYCMWVKQGMDDLVDQYAGQSSLIHRGCGIRNLARWLLISDDGVRHRAPGTWHLAFDIWRLNCLGWYRNHPLLVAD